ncbi:esterase-like activity of phytase family protein [Roseococcus sp. SYP-B2431]|uniref:esterase-like activity of phytase family protein n=1 Tax=Roseococcus sp. SYP-B2431 TaxID=2496640 RepID=UPI00103B8AA7|nr:esterase-like activity of phytase family protein [Roseococcus sp. SYP-B2431]TCH96601.1 esterase-like activity of phytase family protein [Roseococcus sp. SYP-B2431]
MIRRRHLFAGLSLLSVGSAGATGPASTPLALPAPRGGRLLPLGGLELSTSAWGFGGLSALHLAPDLTLTAVSDRGRWWRAPLRLSAGRLAGLGEAAHGPLRDAAGAALGQSANADSESLARLPNGDWLVGFERWHRILRYRDLAGAAQAFEAPPGLEGAPRNGGLEALTVLADGRLLAVAEQLAGGDSESRAAWIGTFQGPRLAWRRSEYRPAPGLDPTDAAGLPDGGALVLERRFSLFGGFSARLAHLPAAALRGTAPLAGETWLELPPDAPAENWEGVATTQHQGRGLVALVSDDNQSPFQRTLLLLYAIA